MKFSASLLALVAGASAHTMMSEIYIDGVGQVSFISTLLICTFFQKHTPLPHGDRASSKLTSFCLTPLFVSCTFNNPNIEALYVLYEAISIYSKPCHLHQRPVLTAL